MMLETVGCALYINFADQLNNIDRLYVHLNLPLVHWSDSLCVTLFIVDWANALANPIAYLSNLEKHTQQLKVLTDDFDVKNDDKGLTDVAEQVSYHL